MSGNCFYQSTQDQPTEISERLKKASTGDVRTREHVRDGRDGQCPRPHMRTATRGSRTHPLQTGEPGHEDHRLPRLPSSYHSASMSDLLDLRDDLDVGFETGRMILIIVNCNNDMDDVWSLWPPLRAMPVPRAAGELL